MNVELLLKIKELYEEVPEVWSENLKRFVQVQDGNNILEWACVLSGIKNTSNLFEDAEKALGISLKQATELAFIMNWPEQFRLTKRDDGPFAQRTTPELARAFIDWFIEKYK